MAKVLISASKAQDLLCNNDHNRILSQARIKEYAEEMRTGMWIYNGESIIVSESGRLLDGQHRLHAIILANTEIETEIVNGVPDQDGGVDTFLTVNTKNRSNKDALYIDGFKEETANIAKLMSFKEAFNSKKIAQKSSGKKLLNHEVVELARDFGEYNALKVIERAKVLATRCDLLALNFWILAVYVFEQLDKGNQFLEQLAECTDDEKENPIHSCISILKEWKSQKLGGAAVSRGKWISIFKAFDAYRKGDTLKNMRVSKTEPLLYPEDYTNYQG